MQDVLGLLAAHGPLTGKELLDKTRGDGFTTWKFCVSAPELRTKIIGRRYLRLDRHVAGFARLSPSILREFLGYTVIGTKGQEEAIEQKAALLRQRIIEISKNKFALAREIIVKSVEAQNLAGMFNERACAIIAGDVVYDMSHMEPRPESSTGRMVQGSDLDIVIVTDGFDDKTTEVLDSALYQNKYLLLTNPSYMEELDYLIKDMAKVEQQLQFDSFASMIACKILDEGKYLYGNHDLFLRIKAKLEQHGLPEKLRLLQEKAVQYRKAAAASLLNHPGPLTHNELMRLFYTTAEKEEFF